MILGGVTLCAQGQPQSAGGVERAPGLSATLASEFSYDDNVLHQQEQTQGSRILLINPQLDYAYRHRSAELNVHYDFAHSHYLDSPVDSYNRHSLNYRLSTRIDRIHRLMLEGAVQSSYEARGLNFSEGSSALDLEAPTPINTHSAQLGYQLGSDAARVRVVASIGRDETDRDSPLIVDDSRDHRANRAGVQLLYRLGWRTDLVAEYRRRDTRYRQGSSEETLVPAPPDSVETQALVGIDLRATAKTSGRVRVGTVERKPVWRTAQWEDAPESELEAVEDPFAEPPAVAAARQGGGTDSFWELTGIWAPRTYSTFTLSSQVSNREPLFVGNYVRSRQFSLAWNHRWNGWLQSEMQLSFGTDEYVGSGRVDDREAFNLRLVYSLDTLMTLGFGLRHQKLDSNFGTVGFDKNVYYLYFNYTDEWRN